MYIEVELFIWLIQPQNGGLFEHILLNDVRKVCAALLDNTPHSSCTRDNCETGTSDSEGHHT